jgi:iron complex outermembrane receptor protein
MVAVLAVVGWSQPAAAQAGASTNPDMGDQAQPVETVVVTARRREEALQSVPISLSVRGGEDLANAGVNVLADAVATVPGVQLTITQGGARFSFVSIRGVGTAVTLPGAEQGVGFYIDEVFYGSNAGINTDLLDIERIEVLRGPQGTLYGRNAIGGAINIVSRRPGFEREVAARATIGSGGHRALQASAVLPLSEDGDTRLSIAGLYRERGGYIANVSTVPGARDIGSSTIAGGRIALLSDFANGAQLTASVDYARDEAVEGGFGDAASVGQTRRVDIAIPFDQEREVYGAMVRLVVPFGGVDLTAITAWRSVDFKSFGGDFSPFPVQLGSTLDSQSQFSQEVRATFETGPVDWIAGAYFYREEAANTTGFGLQGIARHPHPTSRSTAMPCSPTHACRSARRGRRSSA